MDKMPELDVDFIGGAKSLSTSEERTLSTFFQQRKLASKRKIEIIDSKIFTERNDDRSS